MRLLHPVCIWIDRSNFRLVGFIRRLASHLIPRFITPHLLQLLISIIRWPIAFLSRLFVEFYRHEAVIIQFQQTTWVFAIPSVIVVPYLSFDLLASNGDHGEILWFNFMTLSLLFSSIIIIFFLRFFKYVCHQQLVLVIAYKQVLLSKDSDTAT